MFVCHCAVLTDRDIVAAVECGARDECQVAEACGAGKRCGNCLPVVRALLRERGIRIDRPLTAPEIRRALQRVG